jgi:hypothetical protein
LKISLKRKEEKLNIYLPVSRFLRKEKVYGEGNEGGKEKNEMSPQEMIAVLTSSKRTWMLQVLRFRPFRGQNAFK